MSAFSIDVVEQHIRQNHPGCPDFAVAYFSKEVAERDWRDAPLGKAVGITIQTFLRHEMTDYDTLLLHGMDRAEARKRVQPRITAMINSWRKKRKRPSDPSSSETGGNTRLTLVPERDQALMSKDVAAEHAETTDNMHLERRVGMTFNMERDWHTKFKMTAVSLGMDMHQLLIESFAAWERENK